MNTNKAVANDLVTNTPTSVFHPKQEKRGADGAVSTASLVEFLDRLRKSEMSASGFVVVLDTVSRLLKRGQTTEAVPTEWMAERLDLHRNAVGLAYKAAEAAGLLRRIPVLERGAPTRTALSGPSLALVRPIATQPKQEAISPGYRSDSPPQRNRRPRVRASRRSAIATRIGLTARAMTPLTTGQSTITTVSSPAGKAKIALDSFTRGEPAPFTKEAAPARLSPTDLMALATRIPEAAKHAAMAFRYAPELLLIDPAWDLSPEEETFVRHLVQRPEVKPTPSNSSSTVTVVQQRADQGLSQAIWASMPRLTGAIGAKRAGEIVDEIAFMVMCCNLGKGDACGGVRAAVSLIAQGRWNSPRGFTEQWRGAVLRGINATPAE
jgi:hypothetical protein